MPASPLKHVTGVVIFPLQCLSVASGIILFDSQRMQKLEFCFFHVFISVSEVRKNTSWFTLNSQLSLFISLRSVFVAVTPLCYWPRCSLALLLPLKTKSVLVWTPKALLGNLLVQCSVCTYHWSSVKLQMEKSLRVGGAVFRPKDAVKVEPPECSSIRHNFKRWHDLNRD